MAGQARHLHVTPGWGLVGVRLLPAPFYLPYCRGLYFAARSTVHGRTVAQ
jgi:hypothetical protein